MATSFYTEEELKDIGFKSVGKNVLVSKKASLYGAENISIGNHVRIDDFCLLSGNITLGDYIHIAVNCSLFGGNAGIVMEDFSSISSRSVIYAESDDYSGEALTNPTVPKELSSVISEKVTLEKHVIIGSGSTILPGVTVKIGTAVGSMSLVNKSLDEWGIYVGIPCKKIKERSKNLLNLEKKVKEEWK